MARKKITPEIVPEITTDEQTSDVTVTTIEVKSPSSTNTDLKLADLSIQSSKSVLAMKPYDQRTVQVTRRTDSTMHFSKNIIREDFK